MNLTTRSCNRLAGAFLGGWLALHLSIFFPPLVLAVPLLAGFGATAWARPFARPAVALAGGLLVAGFLSLIGGLVGVPLALWLYLVSITAFTTILALAHLELTLQIGNARVAYNSSK